MKQETILDKDIAAIEVMHDLPLDTHGYSLDCITLKRARELAAKLRRMLGTPRFPETVKMPFKDAPVGARFKLGNAVFVKIHSDPDTRGEIVSWYWEGTTRQKHCAFCSEEEGTSLRTEVEVFKDYGLDIPKPLC